QDPLQQRRQHRVLGSQFLVGVRVAPFHFAHDQAVVAHPGALHVEAAMAAHPQGQQAAVVGAEILDPGFGAERGGRGRGTGFLALDDHAHAEAAAFASAFAHQVQVARFEYPQLEQRARHQHRVQREQPEYLRRHGSSAARNRRGAASKPPLDMNTTWSPGRTSARRAATSASTSATARPSPRNADTTAPASQARPGRCRNTTASARSSDGASASACAPMRIELLRGSIATTMRASPTFARNPARVVAMAVGWWAKSSYTAMPSRSPTSSMRRLTLWNPANDGSTPATSTPIACAAANAASAFITLWRPSSGQCAWPNSRPRWMTVTTLPSAASRRACQSRPSPSMPKRSTGVQQPMASTSARRASSPFTTRRPRPGTVRTRWWNWRWIAATSGKMSAWSYSRLLRIATSGR